MRRSWDGGAACFSITAVLGELKLHDYDGSAAKGFTDQAWRLPSLVGTATATTPTRRRDQEHHRSDILHFDSVDLFVVESTLRLLAGRSILLPDLFGCCRGDERVLARLPNELIGQCLFINTPTYLPSHLTFPHTISRPRYHDLLYTPRRLAAF